MKKQIHLAKQVGQGLWLAAEDGPLLKQPAVNDGFDLPAQMIERLDEETARAAGGIADSASNGGVHHLNDDPDEMARGAELR